MALTLLVSTSPGAYFSRTASNGLVITELWEALVGAELVVVDSTGRPGRQNEVLEQLMDVFDASTRHGIPSVVLDTFREASPAATVEHCGITAAECVLKWIARTVEACAAELEEAAASDPSLREHLVRSEAAREAALYALSWQDMERSFHQIKEIKEIKEIKGGREGSSSMLSGPMSQSVVQSFKELAGVAEGICAVIKCKLAVLEVSGGVSEVGGAGRLERCRQAETSLFAGVLRRYGFTGSLEGKSAVESAMALAMWYLEGRRRGGVGHGIGSCSERDLLALFVYCLRPTSDATSRGAHENVIDVLAKYFPGSEEDLRVWALAPLLDESLMDGDDVPLHAALMTISSGALDCRRMPMAYLMALLELGQSALVLSLLYQKWIDPNVVEDVLGCIEILMHEDLVIECYVHVKQCLRQLRDTKAHGNQSYQSKAKLYWQTMFEAGAARGMLFQLIRLPIAAKDEEAYVVEWLRRDGGGVGGVGGAGEVGGVGEVGPIDASERRKALCLYYLIRGRTEEASREVQGIDLDPESDWDTYLGQVCALANQGALTQRDAGFDGDVRVPDVSGDATPGARPVGGLLFGVQVQPMDTDTDTDMGTAAGTENGTERRSRRRSKASAFEGVAAASLAAPAGGMRASGVRGRVAMATRANSKVHQLDRVLG